mgnify:CR=1 FL=1
MIKMELLEQWQQTEIWGLGRMIKLKDLLLEIKPLNNREIKALEKKIDAPIKRGGNKNAIIPPKLSEREKHHIIYVMLKKTRDKNKKEKLKKISSSNLRGQKR